jgi:enoyl-CoA hydratase/carnithine racemase
MGGPPVTFTVDGRIARLELNDPEHRNALSYAMVRELIQALHRVEADPSIRAALLAGAGSHFSAGANLKEFAAELEQPAERHWESGALWEELATLIPRMSKPVVAAVQGYALAGGCGLVALADLAVAADGAKFGMTEIRIGLFPLLVLPALRRAVGHRRALELCLLGDIIDAGEALRIGLVGRVVPAGQLDAAALEVARALAQKSPEAVRMGKHLFRASADMTYDQALALARDLRVSYFASAGLREGIAAFLDKRKPGWE